MLCIRRAVIQNDFDSKKNKGKCKSGFVMIKDKLIGENLKY